MRLALILVACLCVPCAAQELGKADPTIQERIADTYYAFGPDRFEPFEPSLQKLDAVEDKGELVRQLAIFAASPGDEQQPLAAVVILGRLRISPRIAIRALAPYLDTDDRRLRGFVRDYFPRDDDDYLDYVRWMANRGEEIPAPFIRYIYERSPGQALLVLQRGNVDAKSHVQAARTMVEARQQNRELTPKERDEIKRIEEESERKGREGREILLAEHIIDDALWLKKSKFDEQFQEALPEAMAELEKLAKHKQWWARLYVVYIMRQNPALLQDHILRQLAEDENALVRKAAKVRAGRPAPNTGDGRRAEAPVASRKVESRAVGPTSIEVTWQASVGATSYAVQRRQPDTETEFTTIAPNVAGTNYMDSSGAPNTLYEYRVIAQQNP